MKPRLQPFLYLVAMFLLPGCMKPPPVEQPQQQRSYGVPFALDSAPAPLGPSCLTGDLKGARDAVREAIKLDAEYRAMFVEDEDFDAVWDSFGE